MENQKPGAGNEIQLTDAIDTLNKTQRVFAREFKGKRYDVGDKFGFMKTSIDYALKHPQVKDDLQTIHHQPWKTIRRNRKRYREVKDPPPDFSTIKQRDRTKCPASFYLVHKKAQLILQKIEN